MASLGPYCKMAELWVSLLHGWFACCITTESSRTSVTSYHPLISCCGDAGNAAGVTYHWLHRKLVMDAHSKGIE